MSLLFLDIETVPANDTITEEDLISSMPGTIKKEESKTKWLSENNDKNGKAAKAIVKKRSLSHYECKIVCLSYSFNGNKVQAITGTEVLILTRLQDVIMEFLNTQSDGSGLDLVGHNIKEFDAPIIFLRAAKYNLLKLHEIFYFGKKGMIDTMALGTYFDYKGKVSLDTLCAFFDIPTPKGEMDGSKVYDAYKEGRIEDVAKYCNKDVEALIHTYERLSV